MTTKPTLGERLERVCLWGLGLAIAATLLVAGALTLYAHPNGDDFCLAADVREDGALGCVRAAYLTQGGRWVGYVLACGRVALMGLTEGYAGGLLGVMVLCVLAVRFFLGSLLPLKRDPPVGWALALGLVALYWVGVAAPGQTFYWLDASYVYVLNVLGALVVIGLLVQPAAGTRPWRLARAGGAVVLGFLVAASQELYTLILGGVLVIGTVVAFARRDATRGAWLATAVAVGLGLLTVVVAPGNSVRARGNPAIADPSLAASAVQIAQMWLRVLDAPHGGPVVGSHGTPLAWIVDPRLLAATVLIVMAPRLAALRPAWLDRSLLLWRLLLPTVSVVALTGAFFTGGWLLGQTLPLRVFNGLYLAFLLAWFLAVLAWTHEPGDPPAAGRALRMIASSVLALGLLFSPNFKLGLRDLGSGAAAAYDRAMEGRYRAASDLHEKGSGELVVTPIEPWPSSYHPNDLRADPSATQNECWARYLEIDSIRAGQGG